MHGKNKEKPAVEGGNPVRKEFLSFHKPALNDNDIDQTVSVLKSGWLTLGPRTESFERALEKYLGAKHVIAVSSCSEAMFLALKAMGVGPGDEVITSALTFASTVNAIIHAGAVPVLADIESESFGPSPGDVEKKINAATRAVLPVHYGGQACMIDEIIAGAKKRGLGIVEDAAHSFGASVDGRSVGTLGDATAFSFYATKNITAGEGGCIAVEDDTFCERIRKLSFHGISRDSWKRYADRGSWYYEVEYPGYKSNISDIMSALGLSQLERAGHLLERRRRVASQYLEKLKGSPFFELPHTRICNKHSWHLFVIKLRLENLNTDRDHFIKALTAENIGTSVHFIPIHMHPFYKPYLRGDEKFPVCDDFFNRCISLPIYPGMDDKSVDSVTTALKKIAVWYAK